MREALSQQIIHQLIEEVGDAVNTRGVIITPDYENSKTGMVHFNVMDRSHPRFGSNTVTFFVLGDGRIELREYKKRS